MFVLDLSNMNKKGLVMLGFFMLVLPMIVSAQFYDLEYGLYDYFGIGYYGDYGFLFLKAGILMLLFIFLFKGTARMFPENRPAAAVVAGIIAVMAMAFMPAEWVTGLGDASGDR